MGADSVVWPAVEQPKPRSTWEAGAERRHQACGNGCLQIFWHLIMVINPQQGGREGKRDANGFINCTSCKTVHQTTQEFVVHCRSAEPSLPLNALHFNNSLGRASTLRTQSGRKSWQQEVQQTWRILSDGAALARIVGRMVPWCPAPLGNMSWDLLRTQHPCLPLIQWSARWIIWIAFMLWHAGDENQESLY